VEPSSITAQPLNELKPLTSHPRECAPEESIHARKGGYAGNITEKADGLHTKSAFLPADHLSISIIIMSAMIDSGQRCAPDIEKAVEIGLRLAVDRLSSAVFSFPATPNPDLTIQYASSSKVPPIVEIINTESDYQHI
jgi:hypothetical protein